MLFCRLPFLKAFGISVVEKEFVLRRVLPGADSISPLLLLPRCSLIDVTMTQTQQAEFENIRVAVRIRPLNAAEVASHVRTAWRIAQNGVLSFVQQDGTDAATRFAYDEIFEGSATNHDVHRGVVAPMVDEALLGKNATIFAYGQTGSGKTYTIDAMMDMTADQIFDIIRKTPEREFLLKLSAVEVYNEHVHDLLTPPTANQKRGLELQEDAKKRTIVKCLTEEHISSAHHLRKLLRDISKNREVCKIGRAHV